MNPRSTLVIRITIRALSLVLIAGTAQAQVAPTYAGDIGTTFGPVMDTCAFEFSLFDATAGGTRIGPVIERELPVRGGRYEVELDFGPEASDGGSRYLEVAVGCPAGTADLTTLTRRVFVPGATVRSGPANRVTPASQDLGAQPKAALGTGFTYQGELKESGSPVTGLGEFQFSLWDALSGGSQIGATVPAGAVGVEEGRFTAQLDFGAAAFDGDARWLEIAVDYPSGTGSFTTLSPRQPLSAAPYALQTRGIFVDDDGEVGIGTTNPQAQLEVAGDGFLAMRVTNTSSNPGIALQASSWADSGSPVIAVDAYTLSPDGIGVYSFNEAETGRGYAVLAETNSPDGIAIFGNAPRGDQRSTGVGVYGRSNGDDGAAGVYGEATAASSGSYGVRGVALAGDGVSGKNQASGNYGALGTSTAGVHGHAVSTTDYSGHFTGGALRVDDKITLHTESGFPTIDIDPEYGAGNAGRMAIQGNGDYAVIHATGNGSGIGDATLRVINSQTSGGIAAYATSAGDAPTVRIDNSGTGETLRLENSGGGDILVAHDGVLGQDQFRVDGTGVTHANELDIDGDIRTSSQYRYNSDRTFFLSLPVSAFQRSVPDETTDFHARHDYGWVSGSDSSFETTLIAPVQLPQNAEVREFRVYFFDGNGTANLQLHAYLIRASPSTNDDDFISQIDVSTSGSMDSVQTATDSTILQPTVANDTHQYNVGISYLPEASGSSLRFYGCRIEYSVTTLNP